MDLSIVTTLYYSGLYLEEFYRRICPVAQKITEDYEIILVNDGSPDNSLDIVLSFFEKDPKVRVVDLSRNFGHHKAIMTGLAHARGELIFLIDCDLEEEPELLEQFWDELKNSDADVIYGVQQARKGGVFERITGDIFYRLFNILSTCPVPANLITVRLMSKRYVTHLIEHKDREIFLAGLWAITGFEQIPLLVNKHLKGNSTYSLNRKVSILVNSITSFSNKPLLWVFYLGCVIIVVSSISSVYMIVRKLFWGIEVSGWASLIASVWLLGGLTIFCLGIIGIYLSKIFMEVKPRPYTVVRRIYERNSNEVH